MRVSLKGKVRKYYKVFVNSNLKSSEKNLYLSLKGKLFQEIDVKDKSVEFANRHIRNRWRVNTSYQLQFTVSDSNSYRDSHLHRLESEQILAFNYETKLNRFDELKANLKSNIFSEISFQSIWQEWADIFELSFEDISSNVDYYRKRFIECIDNRKSELEVNYKDAIRCIGKILGRLAQNKNADKVIHNNLLKISYKSNNSASEEDSVNNNSIPRKPLFIESITNYEKGRKIITYRNCA